LFLFERVGLFSSLSLSLHSVSRYTHLQSLAHTRASLLSPSPSVPRFYPLVNMRSFALVSILSTLALLTVANPEPCSDHPGVVHEAGTFGTPSKIGTAAKLSLPKSHKSSKSSSSSSKSSHKSTTKHKKVIKHETTPSKKKTSTPSKSSSVKHSWTHDKTPTKKKTVPKVQHSSSKTVIEGANKAVDQFSNSTLIPKPLASALSSAINQQLKPTNVVTSESSRLPIRSRLEG